MKTIKFDLKLSDGTITLWRLKDIEENLSPELLTHFHSGKLAKWLRVRKLEELAEKMEALRAQNIEDKNELDIKLFKNLCEIFVSEVSEKNAREAMQNYQPVVAKSNDDEVEQLHQLSQLMPAEVRSQPSLLFQYNTLNAPKGGEIDRAKHRIKTVAAMVDIPARKYQAYLRSVAESQGGYNFKQKFTETYSTSITKTVPSVLEGCMDAHSVLETEKSSTGRYAVAFLPYRSDMVEASSIPSEFMRSLFNSSPTVEDLVKNFPGLAGLFPAEVDTDKRELLSVCLQSISNALVNDINSFVKYSMGIDTSITYLGDWYELIECLKTIPDIDAKSYIHALNTWINIRWSDTLERSAWEEVGNAVIIRRRFWVAAVDVSVDEMGLALVGHEPKYVSSAMTPVFHSFINSCYSLDRAIVKPKSNIYLAFKGGVNIRVWANLKEPTQFVVHQI